jgi:methylenetetrahydrofolate reductase (NADPH)
LEPYAAVPEYNLAGVHLYTFNQASDPEAWRADRLRE